MRKFWSGFSWLLGVGVLVGVVIGCSSPGSLPEPTVTAQVLSTESAEVTPTTAVLPQNAGNNPAPAAAVQDACVACHTDQQRITETAKPEEDMESESKGVG